METTVSTTTIVVASFSIIMMGDEMVLQKSGLMQACYSINEKGHYSRHRGKIVSSKPH